MQYGTVQEAVDNIDWKLLQQQKGTLEKIISSSSCNIKAAHISDRNVHDLWGLIEFIETLQDIHEQ